ncbi:MAG: capsule biosynthesis protein CapA [Paracoccaceae bacterium]
MEYPSGKSRSFLFLQGPHGPFFHILARMLRVTGAQTWRVGFNAGDRAFWRGRADYIPYTGSLDDWPATFETLIAQKGITDIVLYGDTRPIHAGAVAVARAAGLRIHVFEEGYLRPYWVTYERGGANGHSALMHTSLAELRHILANTDHDTAEAPAHWGDMRHHVFYGALYHWFVMFRNRAYRNVRRHRELPVAVEFGLYLKRLLLMPLHRIERRIVTMRIRHGGFPYHLALLQLEHDSSFQSHSSLSTMPEFIELVIRGFALGAAPHHHLVFKAHPLEIGRRNLRAEVARIAAEYGVAGRVHYLRGGKLAQLLDHARSAVTVNSTAGQQVLWRGLPLKVLGAAIYAKPEFVSSQPLPEFFARPARPDRQAYRDFRQYMLETSQIPGGYYSARGRRMLLRNVVDMMLAQHDPYQALAAGTAPPRPHLRATG